MTVAAAPAVFSIGNVISRTFSVLGRNAVLLLLLSVLLVGIPTAIVNVLQMTLLSGSNRADLFTPLNIGLGLLGMLIGVASNAVLQAAVIYATVDDLSGRKASLGDSLAVGLRYFLPLLGISIIVGAGCFVGAIFFIIPGVLLALALSVAAPVAVMERTGVFGALGRSVELTRNNRGAIFVLGLAYVVVLWIVEMVIAAVIGGFGFASIASSARVGAMSADSLQAFKWISMGLALLTSTLLASLSSAGIASIYFELRQTKEGVGAQQLAAVFD